MYEYRIKCVDRIVDGDTIDVTLDLGFDILHKTRVRLYGINTPEKRTRDLEEKKRGYAASERLAELVDDVTTTHGDELILKTKEKGKYGRYLGIIYRGDKRYNDAILSLNEQLVSEGHAVEYFGGKR